jgi:hypothetical protein
MSGSVEGVVSNRDPYSDRAAALNGSRDYYFFRDGALHDHLFGSGIGSEQSRHVNRR